MKNRIQLLGLALMAFNAFAKPRNLSPGQMGFATKDTTMYITADLKNKGGTIDLIDPNTKKIPGVTNFDGNKLAKGRYLVLDGVRVLVENTQTTVAAAVWKGDAIAAVKASHLVIVQGEEIFNIPVCDLFNDNAATGNDNDFREIGHLPIIDSELEYKIQWVFPTSGGVDGTPTACLARVEFRATEVFVR